MQRSDTYRRNSSGRARPGGHLADHRCAQRSGSDADCPGYRREDRLAGNISAHRHTTTRHQTRHARHGSAAMLYAIHPDNDDATVDVVEIVRIVDGRRDLRRLF